MKSTIVGLLLLAVACVAASSSVYAETDENITQDKIDHIREHCVENQASLNRLRQSDAFLRTDRGNLYRTISDKLMVPLNQRLVSNRLDGGELITTAADFTKEYDTFYDAYAQYATSLTELLSVDCSKQPVTFYNSLLKAREDRELLSESNQRLKALVKQYGDAFNEFKTEYLRENT